MAVTIESGITIGPGIGIVGGILLTTTGTQSYSNGSTMGTFRVLNRGGNWNEFYASYTNGTWSCVQFPGSVVVNITVPDPSEPDSIDITITGGTFVVSNYYSFEGYA
jgi:hypothetical protein